MSDRTTESNITNSKMMALFSKNLLIQEIFFRYSHEMNKVLFWLNTVRQIFDYLFQNKICKAFVVFGCFILVKAKYRCKSFVQSLVRRENKYKLTRFCEFLESSKYEATIAKFKMILGYVRTMEANIKKNKRFNFFIKYYHLEEIFSGKISESEFQKIISLQLTGIISEKIRRYQKNPEKYKLK